MGAGTGSHLMHSWVAAAKWTDIDIGGSIDAGDMAVRGC